MGLKKTIIKDVDDHWVILVFLALFLTALYANVYYQGTNHCHVLEPEEICVGKFLMNIQDLQNNPQWVNTSAFSTHHWIEYRQLADFGFGHCEFNYTDTVGVCHNDSYNALDQPPFGLVAHLADWLSTLLHVEDWMAVILIWGGIFFGGYEMLRGIYYEFFQ